MTRKKTLGERQNLLFELAATAEEKLQKQAGKEMQQRRPATAATVRNLQSCGACDIANLLQAGIVLTGAEIAEGKTIRHMSENRRNLVWNLQRFAQSTYARNQEQREAAWQLLADEPHLSDTEFSERCEEFGFCDSTESFGQPLGPHRYSLFEFRKSRKKPWRKP